MIQMTAKFTRANEPPEFQIPDEKIIDADDLVEIALREGAMQSGAPSVTMVIPTKDGRFVVLETSWKLWNAVTNGFRARIQAWEENPLPPEKGGA